MDCPKCSTPNPAGNVRCEKCDSLLSEETILPTQTLSPGWSSAAAEPTEASDAEIQELLNPGSVLGERYEILETLGKGGMGAVYKARDRELDRVVALKIIRPELAGQAEIMRRFKQEILLASRITHKNIIRIFDLGQAGGIKFITMEYVEGRDLKTLLQTEPKFSTERTVGIIKQVCRALDAAHAESVVHRDLKPSNIMLDSHDKVTVMDFGIARSTEVRGVTRTGAVIGTPEYMSPEQAISGKVDARSDLFSMGLIFYEMLTGRNPFEADTAIGTLVRRTQERATPPAELDHTIPPALNAIVVKCLAKDPEARYRSAQEVLSDLESGQAPTHVEVMPPPPQGEVKPDPRRRGSALPWKWLAAGAAIVILAVAGYLLRDSFLPHSPAQQKPITVLVADFDNHTSDAVFDGTLEPILNVAMEGASFITAYKRSQARRIAEQLQPGATRIDESAARLVARREGIEVILTGSISGQGSAYDLSVKALDAVTGKPIAAREAKSVKRESVVAEIGRLAAPIRSALGDTTPESAQIAAGETFTTANLDAAHLYSTGQELVEQGKSADAISYYQSAIQLDPKFARVYAALAVASLNLKRQEQAAEYYKRTMSMLDQMSEREKLRTLGAYYSAFMHNYPQAIETYRKLVFLYPGDGVGWNNLSIALVFSLNIPEALTASRRALEASPRSLQYRLNLALYSMYAGEFQNAITEAQTILKENPTYEFAYLPLALSTLAGGDVPGARAIYARFEKVSAYGFSLAKMGEADLEMYLGRYREALEPTAAGIAADTKEKTTGELALKYVAEAEARQALGETAQAVALAGKAVELLKADNVLLPAARVLIQAGQETKARAIAETLNGMLQTQTRSYARLIEGEIALHQKQIVPAVDALQEAQKLHNSWLSHFILGRAYIEGGHAAEALAEFETCRKRRGETSDLLFADTTTLRYLPPLYYWLARAQEGTGMTQAARETYQQFLKLRTDAGPGDPLVADARRRVGQ